MSNKYSFEDQFRKRRSELDSDVPNHEKIWANIEIGLSSEGEQSITKTKAIPKPKENYWKWAAVLLFGLSLGLLLNQEQPTAETEQALLGSFSEELQEQEQEYLTQIGDRMKVIQTKSKGQEIDLFQEDLQQLDSLKLDLILDKQQSPNREKLVEIMIKYYERKVYVLDKVIGELEKTERENLRDNETNI